MRSSVIVGLVAGVFALGGYYVGGIVGAAVGGGVGGFLGALAVGRG